VGAEAVYAKQRRDPASRFGSHAFTSTQEVAIRIAQLRGGLLALVPAGLVGPEPVSFGSGDCPTIYLVWRRLEVDAELRALR